MTLSNYPFEYLRLRLTARPPRVAIILPGTKQDFDWLGRAFTGASRIWGGASFVVFPHSLNTRAVWRRLIQAYDPDRVILLARTFRGEFLEHEAQEARRAALQKRAEQLAEQDGLDVQLVYEALEGEQDRPYDGVLDDEVLGWLQDASAPLDTVGPAWLSLGTSPGYHFEDLVGWETSDLGPIQLLRSNVTSKYLNLLVTSRVGGLDAEYWGREIDSGKPPRHYTVENDDLTLLMKYCWLGRLDESDLGFRHAAQRAQGLPETTPEWFSAEVVGNTPMQRSLLGCTWLYPQLRRLVDSNELVTVVGDTAEDFCLFQVARNVFGGAVWIPPQWISGGGLAGAARTAFSSAIADYSRGREAKVLFTSISMSRRRIQRAAQKLIGVWSSRTSWEVIEPDELPGAEAPFVADADIWEVNRWAPFSGHLQGDDVETPIPDVIRQRAPENAAWHIDVRIDGHLYPVRGVLKPTLTGKQAGLDGHNVRPSRNGTSYWSEGVFRMTGQPLRTQIVRPRLRTPPPIEVFSVLMSDSQLDCQYSDKGHYTANAIRLWGGLEQVADDLTRSGTRSALMAFLSERRSGVDPGVYLRPDSRRYLSAWDLRRASGLDRSTLREWLDTLVEKKVLTRGLVLRCDNCRYAGWYESTLVGREFECRRCRTSQVMKGAAWKKPTEPLWYYELAEVVFQALRSDCSEVVLALNHLKKSSKRAFHYEPQMELVRADEVISEIDIWAISDGQVILGEVKSGNRLGSNREEERSVALKLYDAANACKADRLLLASTARIGWRTSTRDVVEEVFEGSHMAVDWVSNLGH